MELTPDRPVAGGRMLARHEGRVVLVAGAIPGERVRVEVERASRDVTFARVVDVLDASPDRREPPVDPACGGAVYAHIAYERQRGLKAQIIADAFRRIGKSELAEAVPVHASREDGYRLRARLHLRQRRAGFFREGTHTLCDAAATRQLLPDTMPAVDAVLAAIGARLADCEALIVAENVAATERVIHVEPRPGARLDDLVRRIALPDRVSGLTTGRHGRLTVLAGTATVTDHAADLFGETAPVARAARWTRHGTSFFQGNRYLTGDLVRRVLDVARGTRFVDLYAGVGLFSVALAASGMRGLAVEGDRSSAGDLAHNAAAWSGQLRTLRAPVEEAVTMPLDPAPDVVVVDPPRTGITPVALAGLIGWAAPRIVYVSCDPPTLARDARRLIDSGYAMTSAEAFDLFPNTAHVETVAVFNR